MPDNGYSGTIGREYRSPVSIVAFGLKYMYGPEIFAPKSEKSVNNRAIMGSYSRSAARAFRQVGWGN